MVHLAFAQSWISAGICHTDEYTRSGKDPEVRPVPLQIMTSLLILVHVFRASFPSFWATRAEASYVHPHFFSVR